MAGVEAGRLFEEAAAEDLVAAAALEGEEATAAEATVVGALRHEDGADSGREDTVVEAVLDSHHIEPSTMDYLRRALGMWAQSKAGTTDPAMHQMGTHGILRGLPLESRRDTGAAAHFLQSDSISLWLGLGLASSA